MTTCIICHQKGSLYIFGSFAVTPDIRSDEITLQFVACTACSFRAIHCIESTTRGADDQLSVDSVGYRCTPFQFETLLDLYIDCPHPEQAECSCVVHTQSILNQRGEDGRYSGLRTIDTLGAYALPDLGTFESGQFWYIFREVIHWQPNENVLIPYQAALRGSTCTLISGSFPDRLPFVLCIDGKETISFTSIPQSWIFE